MLKGHASLERLLGRSGARKRARPKDSSRRNKKRRADGGGWVIGAVPEPQ